MASSPPVRPSSPGPSPVGPATVVGLRFRHGGRLARDLLGFAVVNRAWWVIPVVVVLALVTIFIVVGQAAAPYTLYTVF